MKQNKFIVILFLVGELATYSSKSETASVVTDFLSVVKKFGDVAAFYVSMPCIVNCKMYAAVANECLSKASFCWKRTADISSARNSINTTTCLGPNIDYCNGLISLGY
jgi:hypothetical protein